MLLFFFSFICDQPTELHWQGFSHVCAVSFSSAWDPIQNCLNLKSWPVVNVKTAHEKHEHQVFLKHRDPAGLFLNRCLWSDSLNLWLISLFFTLWLCNQKIADRKHVEAVLVSGLWNNAKANYDYVLWNQTNNCPTKKKYVLLRSLQEPFHSITSSGKLLMAAPVQPFISRNQRTVAVRGRL